MLDDRLNPWLLEMNLSPGLNRRTHFLDNAITKMLKGMFEIVLGSPAAASTSYCGWNRLCPKQQMRRKHAWQSSLKPSASNLAVKGSRLSAKHHQRLEAALVYSDAIRKINSFYNNHAKIKIGFRKDAAIAIQCRTRGYLFRVNAKRDECAIMMQRLSRGFTARLRFYERKRSLAVRRVQHCWRKRAEKLRKCAMTMQCAARRFMECRRTQRAVRCNVRWRRLIRQLYAKMIASFVATLRYRTLQYAWMKVRAEAASVRIQRFLQKRAGRRDRAATCLARSVRSHFARRHAMRHRVSNQWRRISNGYAVQAMHENRIRRIVLAAWNRALRRLTKRKHLSAKTIQNATRRRQFLLARCAIRIQAVWRVFSSKRQVAVMRDADAAMKALCAVALL